MSIEMPRPYIEIEPEEEKGTIGLREQQKEQARAHALESKQKALDLVRDQKNYSDAWIALDQALMYAEEGDLPKDQVSEIIKLMDAVNQYITPEDITRLKSEGKIKEWEVDEEENLGV